MAVYDLSTIGLDGQQAFYTRMQTAAQAETMHAAAQKNQFDLEQDQRMQALADEAAAKLQSIAHRTDDGSGDLIQDDGTDNQASVLDQLGKMYIAGGAPKAGMDFIKGAQDIRDKQSQIENRTAEMEQKRIENIQKGAQIAGTKLGKARNQSEWEQGLREVEAAGVIEPHLMDQLKQMPYDPDVAQYFYDQAISASDQARLDLEKLTQERLARQNATTNERAERQLQLSKTREENLERHRRVLEKASGAKGGAVPAKKELLNSAKLVLQQSVFKGADVSDPEKLANFNAAADYISSQAQQILKNNKAIDSNTALQQAVIQAKQAGAFSVTPGEPGWFTKDGIGSTPGVTEFKADGLQKETAIPLPPGIRNAKEAASKLQKGKWYNTTRGPAKWNGSAWEQ